LRIHLDTAVRVVARQETMWWQDKKPRDNETRTHVATRQKTTW